MKMNFRHTKEFDRDFKRLAKKYRSLSDDLDEFKKVVKVRTLGIGKNFVILTQDRKNCIIKARLFCRNLKGSSLRIIYAYIQSSDKVEFIGIEFIELYYKGDKVREDIERIKNYLEQI
ncbi:MAG: hypothetical protein ABIH87_00840 [bacterium]